MGAGASAGLSAAAQCATNDDLTKALAGVSADERLKIRSALDMLEKSPGAPAAMPAPSTQLIDVATLTVVAKESAGILEQPEHPKYKGALVQVFVRGTAPFGGSDKSSSGHRFDSTALANGLITAGLSCQMLHYKHEEHDKFFAVLAGFDFVLLRCLRDQIEADGGDQRKFDESVLRLRSSCVQVWPCPDLAGRMGAKAFLAKIAHFGVGGADTKVHRMPEDFAQDFKRTIKAEPRVIKHNRSFGGEGVWIIKLKSGEYSKDGGDASVANDDILCLTDASDNHEEEHSVAEFVEFCINGAGDKAGAWTSKSVGKYFDGKKSATGYVVDQHFCERIGEGQIQCNFTEGSLIDIVEKKPKDGCLSAEDGAGATCVHHGPGEPKFAGLIKKFVSDDLPLVLPALRADEGPLPLLWSADFILLSPPGASADDEKWVATGFTASCAAISRCSAARCTDSSPNARHSDIAECDRGEAVKHGKLVGEKAIAYLDKVRAAH